MVGLFLLSFNSMWYIEFFIIKIHKMKNTEYLENLNDGIVSIDSINQPNRYFQVRWNGLLSIHENKRFRKVDIHWYIDVKWVVSNALEGVRITLSDIIEWNNHDYVWVASKIESLDWDTVKTVINNYHLLHIQLLTWLNKKEMDFLRSMKFVKHMSPYERQRHEELTHRIHCFQMERSSGYKTLLNERNWIIWDLELF